MKLPSLQMPIHQLQNKKQLELTCVPWEPAGLTAGQPRSAKQSVSQANLASLTALTYLSLNGNSVRLAGLEALTALKALNIAAGSLLDATLSDDEAAAGPSNFWDSAGAVLVAALPKLQALTHLRLYIESQEVIAEVGTPQHLEQLNLTLPLGAPTITLPAISKSLTELTVCFIGNQSGFDGIAPRGFCRMHHCEQLTGLRVLQLHNVAALDAAVLASMTGLVCVEFENVNVTSASTQPMLAFSKLQALQELTLSDTNRFALTPAEAAALTSSRHLAYLDLQGLVGSHDSLQLAHYKAMFPTGGQLQQLRELRVGTTLVATADTALIGQLAKCCPRLHDLALGQPSWAAPLSADLMLLDADVIQQLSAGLRALTCLRDLSELRFYTPTCELSAVVWHALATLTVLTELGVECASPCADHIMLLTSCRQLDILEVQGEHPEAEYLFELFVESEVSWKADQLLASAYCTGSKHNNQFVGLWVTMLVALRHTGMAY